MGTTHAPSGVDILDRPVTEGEKAQFVRQMFDDIAPRYDFLNALLSAGIHSGWRTFATRCALLSSGEAVLDLCSGTGEWTVPLREAVGPTGQVIGADFSLPMLRSGADRFERTHSEEVQGDAARLPFADSSFEAVTIAFGIRNVADRDRAFREMTRVLKPGGRVVCLEFSQPPPGLFSIAYDLHAKYIMPTVGGAVSGRPDAYAYLPESMKRFDNRACLAARMQDAGLADVRWVDLTFGLVCVHVGVKPAA